MNILKASKIKSVLSVHSQMVFKLLTCLVQVKNKNFTFLLTAMETIIKFKKLFRKPQQISVPAVLRS
jgi:hypothetical protein